MELKRCRSNCSQQGIKQSRLAKTPQTTSCPLSELLHQAIEQPLRYDEVPVCKNSFILPANKWFLSITTGKLEDHSVGMMCNVSHHFKEIRHDSVWKSPLNVRRLRPSSHFLYSSVPPLHNSLKSVENQRKKKTFPPGDWGCHFFTHCAQRTASIFGWTVLL